MAAGADVSGVGVMSSEEMSQRGADNREQKANSQTTDIEGHTFVLSSIAILNEFLNQRASCKRHTLRRRTAAVSRRARPAAAPTNTQPTSDLQHPDSNRCSRSHTAGHTGHGPFQL